MEQRVVVLQGDKLGTVRFKQIADEIKRRRPKGVPRLDKIQAVFSHVTQLGVQVEIADDRWARQSPLHRLEQFKPPEYFIGAAQTILDEIREEDRASELIEAEKRAKRMSRYRY